MRNGDSERNGARATHRARQQRYVRRGRQIACVIRDPDALDALRGLERAHGGVTAAVTAALRSSAHLHHLDDARVRSSP